MEERPHSEMHPVEKHAEGSRGGSGLLLNNSNPSACPILNSFASLFEYPKHELADARKIATVSEVAFGLHSIKKINKIAQESDYGAQANPGVLRFGVGFVTIV